MTALQIFVLLGISASVGAALALFISLSTEIPKIDTAEAPEATIIFSSDGAVLGRIYREDRTNVPLKLIPKQLRDATIAIEDKRFYQHSGVDMKGIIRALWANLRRHHLAQGGSTITQQLARNVYLTQRKTVERKAQEAVLAILMERHFTKDKILELYLNRVYYGSGAFGVQAASKVYFGKDVSKLTLSEAALVAGLPQKPSGFSPHEDLQAAITRRDTVLKEMAIQGKITTAQRDEAMNERLRIVPRATGRNQYKAPHFVDYVIKQLKDRYHYTDDVLYSGGLRVYTTLNYEMQQVAEDALRKGVKRFEKTRRVTEGCFAVVEPDSGYIRAMVGSVNPSSQYNRCVQGAGQQPGSSFKAFVYTAAFEKGGMTPTTRVDDVRDSWPSGSGGYWSPRNYDGKYHGWVSIKSAIAQSMNLAAIHTAEKVGIQRVIDYAHLMGITTELQPYLSTAIGACEVHPLEMASAYGTFANDGIHMEPMAVVRITDSRGKRIADFSPEGQQVISKKTSGYMDECLRAVVTSGTGRPAGIVPNARGKTGTTNDDRDAWFIGYVPHKLVGACWVGNDNNASMRGAYGSVVCAPVWREFMLKSVPILDQIRKREADRAQRREEPARRIASDKPAQERPKPERTPDVATQENTDTGGDEYAICDVSHKLATENCPSHLVRFANGTQPTGYCTLRHTAAAVDEEPSSAPARPTQPASDSTLVTVTICPDSGLLAGPGCPSPTRKRIPIDDVPTQVCNVHRSGNR